MELAAAVEIDLPAHAPAAVLRCGDFDIPAVGERVGQCAGVGSAAAALQCHHEIAAVAQRVHELHRQYLRRCRELTAEFKCQAGVVDTALECNPACGGGAILIEPRV